MTEASIDRIVEEARARAAERRRSFVWSPDGGSRAPAPAPPAPARPLEVLLPDRERTLFHYVRDPRLTLRMLEPGRPLEAAPDVVVLTRIDRREPEASAAGLSAEVWQALSEGRAALVLDASGEGSPFWPQSADRLHRFLRAHGVRPSMAAFVTQDRGWPAAYEAYCEERGLGGERIGTWNHDLYIQRLIAESGRRGEGAFRRRLDAYVARGPRRRRRFVSLNRTLRPVKTLFLLRLMQLGLFDSGFVSLGVLGDVGSGKVVSLPEYAELLTQARGLGGLAEELMPYLDRLAAIGPIDLGYDVLKAAPLKAYDRSWFTVVTESHVSDRLHRITEKPLKPILNFHPFLVLGCVGSLRLLRAYGFETFPQMFDERYDETTRLRKRFDNVVEQTRRLCLASDATLAELDRQVAPTVVFNAWWGLVELPEIFHSHIEARLIDDLVRLHARGAEA